jgi:hypothetical protein
MPKTPTRKIKTTLPTTTVGPRGAPAGLPSASAAKAPPAAAAAPVDVESMPPAALSAVVAKVIAIIASGEEMLTGLVSLTSEERLRSGGPISPDEAAAMKVIMNAAAKYPQYFIALADKDGGVDPEVFESAPALDDLARLSALRSLLAPLEAFQRAVGDTILAVSQATRELVTPVRVIIRANRAVAPALATAAAAGLEYYDARGKKSALTKKKVKKAKAASGKTA